MADGQTSFFSTSEEAAGFLGDLEVAGFTVAAMERWHPHSRDYTFVGPPGSVWPSRPEESGASGLKVWAEQGFTRFQLPALRDGVLLESVIDVRAPGKDQLVTHRAVVRLIRKHLRRPTVGWHVQTPERIVEYRDLGFTQGAVDLFEKGVEWGQDGTLVRFGPPKM